jgi:hypothetical protein
MAVEDSSADFGIYSNDASLIHILVALCYYSFQCKAMNTS